jgi:methylglutaconyl-CoA hydratase
MYKQSDLIEVKVTGCAGTIIINRPDCENRLTRLMIREIEEALDDLYREKAVRAIILTGAGDTFCQGVDLLEMTEEDPAQTEQPWGDDAAAFRDLLVRMLEITKPIIAAVNGAALSGGAGLVAQPAASRAGRARLTSARVLQRMNLRRYRTREVWGW